MESNREAATERRREQNRLAQRRFREKNASQKPASKTQSSGDGAPSPPATRQRSKPPAAALSTSAPSDPGPAACFGSRPLSATGLSDGSTLLCEQFVGDGVLDACSPLFDDGAISLDLLQEGWPPLSDFVDLDEGDDAMAAAAAGDSPAVEGAAAAAARGGGAAHRGWMTALHIAVQQGHEAIVRLLLQHQPDCNERDSDGLTPLAHAVARGHAAVVSCLLAHGARLDDVDRHRGSALHLAIAAGQDAVLQLLLRHCAGDVGLINGYNDAWRTPFHLAVEMGSEVGIQSLLKAGASIKYRAGIP